MGLIEVASANSVWRGMDYYENKKSCFMAPIRRRYV